MHIKTIFLSLFFSLVMFRLATSDPSGNSDDEDGEMVADHEILLNNFMA